MALPTAYSHVERRPFQRSNPDAEKIVKAYVAEHEIPQVNHLDNWHGESAVPEIPNWKEEMAIERPVTKVVLAYFLNLSLLLFPFAFLALGIAIAVLNNRRVEDIIFGGLIQIDSDHIQVVVDNATKWAVTIWPIGFGIILCRVLKIAASYKAEKGTHLMTLEQLVASKSFGSSMLAPLNFKRVNFTMLCLFSLWALSPIMTQALQRIFTIGIQISKPETNLVKYVDTFVTPGQFHFEPDLLKTNGVFLMTMLSRVDLATSSTTDPWGNPKIPTIESVQHYPKDNDWYLLEGQHSGLLNEVLDVLPLEKPNYDIKFSSILGLTTLGVPKNSSVYGVSSRFKVETGYFTMDCSPFKEITGSQLNETFQRVHAGNVPDTYGVFACPPSVYSSHTDFTHCGDDIQSLYMQMRTDRSLRPVELQVAALVKRLEKENGDILGWYEHTTCKIASRRVESEILCAGRTCNVAKIRLLANQTLLPDDGQGGNIPGFMLAPFVQSTMSTAGSDGGHYYLDISILQSWLARPATALAATGRIESNTTTVYPNMSHVPITTFNERLAMLYNTYYQAGYAPSVLTQGPSDLNDTATLEDLAYVSNKTTQATTRQYTTVYICHMGWFAVLVAECVIVIVLIVIGAYLSANVLGPDIMGYVSAFTRNNSYIPLPRGGSLLDGLERTRKLGDLKVRLQDVHPDQQVGHVALSSVQGEPLRKGRSYW